MISGRTVPLTRGVPSSDGLALLRDRAVAVQRTKPLFPALQKPIINITKFKKVVKRITTAQSDMNKFFIYIRKSTDESNKQVLSLEAQETELLEFARKDRLEVTKTFRESQTAKEPGRPVFNQMLEQMEKGKAQGILAWHPDRLARNSVDGGKIIHLIDTGKITALKFPTFWFEATPQGKFMLNIAFGQSKYFIDNLSENVKRGMRQKVRRGEWPGVAPCGYLNELKNHTIVKDPERFNSVRKTFELYSTGNYSLKDLRNKISKAGLVSRYENKYSISNFRSILSNPFYYGAFKYYGELHQGIHKPAISKKLFDKVQNILKDRTRPKKKSEKVYPFRGLLKCAECGCSITSQIQKGHIYYNCTKKRIPCSQPYIREENLAEQISKSLQKVSLSLAWMKKMIAQLNKEKEENIQTKFSFAQNLKLEIKKCENKLDKLLDAHLEDTISKNEYLPKKEKILNQKIENEEKLRDFEQKGNRWLELCKKFILLTNQAKIVALHGNLFEKRNFLKKIGSNPLLRDKKIILNPRGAWKILTEFNLANRATGAENSKHLVWQARQGSNLRPSVLETDALPAELRALISSTLYVKYAFCTIYKTSSALIFFELFFYFYENNNLFYDNLCTEI